MITMKTAYVAVQSSIHRLFWEARHLLVMNTCSPQSLLERKVTNGGPLVSNVAVPRPVNILNPHILNASGVGSQT